MLIQYFCKVRTNTLFFHWLIWLICILFYVQTKWPPEQNLRPSQSQNVLKGGDEKQFMMVLKTQKEISGSFQIIRVSSSAKPRMRSE